MELLAAKKQASKAHENSYLGQVLRGEKKMKRFVRTGGGQVCGCCRARLYYIFCFIIFLATLSTFFMSFGSFSKEILAHFTSFLDFK